jgi:hypothetical protein
VKDPNKSVMRIYAVPVDAFSGDEVRHIALHPPLPTYAARDPHTHACTTCSPILNLDPVGLWSR